MMEKTLLQFNLQLDRFLKNTEEEINAPGCKEPVKIWKLDERLEVAKYFKKLLAPDETNETQFIYYDKEVVLPAGWRWKVVRVAENGKAVGKGFVDLYSFKRATLIKKSGQFYEFILERINLDKKEIIYAFCSIETI